LTQYIAGPSADEAPVTVRDNPSEHRFEVLVGGARAGFVTYRPGSEFSFLHTEIDPAFEGRGLASLLIRGALDEMSDRGLGVLPYCPFVLEFLRRHPDYLPLVPASHRERFDLPAAT
jgi:predicted GNAT family acetyltransferase